MPTRDSRLFSTNPPSPAYATTGRVGPSTIAKGPRLQDREGLSELLRGDLVPTPRSQEHEPGAGIETQRDVLFGIGDVLADAMEGALN